MLSMNKENILRIGSINSFAEEQGLDPKAQETFSEYTAQLSNRRRAVAKFAGIALEELHAAALVESEVTSS